VLSEIPEEDLPPAVEADEIEPSGSDVLGAEPVLVTVEARAHGWRVDHYLSRIYPNYSRVLFQRAIDEGSVTVNGLVVKAARRLRVNDRVSIKLPAEPDNNLQSEDIPIEILFEDEFLAIINKPADMVTHPGKGNFKGTLAAAVQFHFDQLSSIAGQLRPGIVHRLDRDTTGVIIIAKDNQVHHRLTRQFEQREVKKEYCAIVRGNLQRDADYIRNFLKSHPRAHERMIVCGPDDGGREAVTFYEVVERFRGFTFVRLKPETGRTHQLRVHMQSVRCSILADKMYAGHDKLLLSELVADRETLGQDATLIARQALHAHRIQFRHPATDQELQFEAPLPADMQQTLDALRHHRRSH
jgi:23S rRNA pseudouridine1911/1915/1917 synthase